MKITHLKSKDGLRQLVENKPKVHRHAWVRHCDCEYCNFKTCEACGEEDEMSRKDWDRL